MSKKIINGKPPVDSEGNPAVPPGCTYYWEGVYYHGPNNSMAEITKKTGIDLSDEFDLDTDFFGDSPELQEMLNKQKEKYQEAVKQDNADSNDVRDNSTTPVTPEEENKPEDNKTTDNDQTDTSTNVVETSPDSNQETQNTSTGQDDSATSSEQNNNVTNQTAPPEPVTPLVSYDPRLARSDQFIIQNITVNRSDDEASISDIVVPFASDTAASCFYDQVFSIDKAVAGDVAKKRGNPNGLPGIGDKDGGRNMIPLDAEAVATDNAFYGVQSLINPYSITKLVGGLQGVAPGKQPVANYMYDIRDQRRFYDVYNNGDDEFLSISEPTTTNIVLWSNRDLWGRTPYSFQDFCFCKWWNVIPNNRLITLRKYHAPTFDNLNFDGMYSNAGDKSTPATISYDSFAPICTVLTYFGGNTGNTLSDLLSFSAGTPWEEIESKVHDVEGDEGSNPDTLIDNMFKDGGGFGGAENSAINSIMHMANVGVGKLQSFGSFIGLATGVYNEKSENVNKLSEANMDPYRNGPFNNRVIGPVNRIDKIKKRKEGINFEHSINITCEYVTRNIGGLNPKAVMLDIFANCMEMATQDAVFWGGGYRFNIKPQIYPWKSKNPTFNKIRGIMSELYKGNIFGKNGAVSQALSGVRSLGNNGDGKFTMDGLINSVKDVFGTAIGCIGAAINSLTQMMFGKPFPIIDDFQTMIGVTKAQKEKGKNILNNITTNLENMHKSRIIQKTIYPTVNGMQALLIGLPVGNWHLTIGNPLNPIAVIGNLICEKVQTKWSDELGPDDFPTELKVTYTLSHGMARDKAGIQSMFNRGCGRIYSLPDYIRASSDTGETKVDIYTGGENGNVVSFREPSYIKTASLNAHGLQKYKIPAGTIPTNSGDGATIPTPKFMPFTTDNMMSRTTEGYSFIQNNSHYYTISVVRAHKNARKFLV